MDYRKISLGLGAFSLALGAVELLGSRRIARALGANGYDGLVKGFGAREAVAGIGLVQAPAHSARMWNRVAGDAMDLGALGLAARNHPKNKAVWGALAFVAGVTLIDALVARGLDRGTGKTAPVRLDAQDAAERLEMGKARARSDEAEPARTEPAAPAAARPTSPEPPHVAHGTAPAVG